MTMTLVANRQGHQFYRGENANGILIFSVVPDGSPAPTGGCDNSYKACNGLYNIFKILR